MTQVSAAASQDGGTLYSYINDGNAASPSFTRSVVASGDVSGVLQVRSGDFNDDAWPDLAVVCPNAGQVRLFLNEAGNGNWTDVLVGQVDGPVALGLADLDGDGNLDIFSVQVRHPNNLRDGATSVFLA